MYFRYQASLLYFLALGLLLAINSSAEPIIGLSPRTLTMKDIMLKTHIEYIDFTHYSLGGEWRDFGEDSTARSILALSEFSYGFDDCFTVRVVIPCQLQDFGESKKSTGLNDIILDFKYNFYNPTKALAFVSSPKWIYPEFSILAGARLPTGNKNTNPPLGDGSTDLELCGLVRVGNNTSAIYISVGYWFNNLTKKDMEDELFYNLSLELPPLFNKLIFLTELNGFAGNKGKTHLAQICPGAQYRMQYTPGAKLYSEVKQELLIECSVKIPFKIKGELKYSLAPYTGLSWRF